MFGYNKWLQNKLVRAPFSRIETLIVCGLGAAQRQKGPVSIINTQQGIGRFFLRIRRQNNE